MTDFAAVPDRDVGERRKYENEADEARTFGKAVLADR